MKRRYESIWDRISNQHRKKLVWALWFVTWVGLIIGFFNRSYYEYVVFFSAAHAILFLILTNFRVMAFPVQLRISYLAWVAVGTYVPYLVILMYITTIGLASNLFLNYCPLARMMYLLPWNREETLTYSLIKRVILTPPVLPHFRFRYPPHEPILYLHPVYRLYHKVRTMPLQNRLEALMHRHTLSYPEFLQH